MQLPIVFILLLLPVANLWAASIEEISQLVGDGHWQEARAEIAQESTRTNLSFQTRQDLLFQSDRMQRIRLDFNKTRERVIEEARATVPSLSEEQFTDWENAGSVEFLEIDGTRWYYSQAAANLFRLNPEARALKAKLQPGTGPKKLYRLDDIRNVIANYDQTGDQLNSPRTWRVTYVLSVKPGAAPPGEVIRAWLPFPHEGARQNNIRLIATDPPKSILSDSNAALASVYLERSALADQPTKFKIVFECTCDAFYQPIDPTRLVPVDTNDPVLGSFLGEQPPNIVFSDEIKQLSQQIVGSETNSYLKARRIFEWVTQHVTWTTAREYSTLECLPHYALSGHHGDCGIKTMTFMTLCRFNGIPARWETGWTTDPVKDMHDWCEIYLAPYGWVPADVTFGLADSGDGREKWFYLGGIDAGRFVVNTDYAQPLYPAKTFFRSEIVDFQRGEVEWRGGNLYFNQWSYDYNVEEIPPIRPARTTESAAE